MDNSFEFQPFDKIARLKREVIITEKLDGTNAQVMITHESPVELPQEAAPYILAYKDDMCMMAGSRKRWICPEGTEGVDKGCDNFGFAQWVQANQADLFQLGEGRHYGEWYGKGIQRHYDLDEKRFALFNVARWGEHNPDTPEFCEVVCRITDEEGENITDPDEALQMLDEYGSQQSYYDSYDPDTKITRRIRFDNPEGVIVWHTASRTYYKMTFGMDGKWMDKRVEAA